MISEMERDQGCKGGREQESEEIIQYSEAEEAHLLEQSNKKKADANALFGKKEYSDAITAYTDALSSCPNYLDYEIAVLKSNVAACHLKLQNWKDATTSATSALERLQNLDKRSDVDKEKDGEVINREEIDETITSAGASTAHDYSNRLKRDKNIEKIKIKALMRRARASCELGGWSVLESAQDDYTTLSNISSLSVVDRKFVQKQLITLPSRIKSAKDKEVGELMGQLKNLGNGILKPFGLSTDNFKFQKDEKTGGYSMNFNQSPSGS